MTDAGRPRTMGVMLLALLLTGALQTPAAPPPSEVDRLRGYMAIAKGNGGLMYRLAQALARAGQAEEAVLWLKTGLDQGLDLDLGDDAFKDLRDRADFKEQLVRTQEAKAVAPSRVAFGSPSRGSSRKASPGTPGPATSSWAAFRRRRSSASRQRAWSPTSSPREGTDWRTCSA